MLRAFESEGLEYVLIGATAMGFHGVVRATEDIDLVAKAMIEIIERLRRALRAAYDDDANIDEIRTSDLLGDNPAVRYYPPSGGIFFDVMTLLGEVAGFETIEAEVREVEGIRVRVATPAALYRLKKDTVRELDRRDAAVLRERFNLGDTQHARPGVSFHRREERGAGPCASWICV
ncbi:MAG: nucleotidyl transferase AbiEii/AbiGii toxin family protein [Acidobacteria bacterium]|nr:nucleotidyl transferase AbiEii/AbiGii toxin family protein [Acidobacteriota bacterium]